VDQYQRAAIFQLDKKNDRSESTGAQGRRRCRLLQHPQDPSGGTHDLTMLKLRVLSANGFKETIHAASAMAIGTYSLGGTCQRVLDGAVDLVRQ